MSNFPEMRPIPGCDGYFVSWDGRVFSDIPRHGRHPQGLIEIKLQVKGNRTGHLSFTVPGRRSVYAHRSVALAWIGPGADGEVVCHCDGDPSNNRADNLRWDTMVGNMADKVDHGTAIRGEDHTFAKLTADQVREIREIYQARTSRYWGCRALSKRFGVSDTAISFAASGRQWRSV